MGSVQVTHDKCVETISLLIAFVKRQLSMSQTVEIVKYITSDKRANVYVFFSFVCIRPSLAARLCNEGGLGKCVARW